MGSLGRHGDVGNTPCHLCVGVGSSRKCSGFLNPFLCKCAFFVRIDGTNHAFEVEASEICGFHAPGVGDRMLRSACLRVALM